MPHQADSPRFTIKGSKSRTDFDAVVVQQCFANSDIIDALGNPHRIEHWQRVPLLANVLDAKVRQAISQEFMHGGVTGKASIEPFFQCNVQSFIQRVEHVDRRGVMVDAILAPVVSKHRDIQIPTLNFGLPRIQLFNRAL